MIYKITLVLCSASCALNLVMAVVNATHGRYRLLPMNLTGMLIAGFGIALMFSVMRTPR